MKNTRKLVFIAILISLSVVLGIVDRTLTIMVPMVFIPNSKIGLANIVILIAIYNFSFKESFTIAFLKSIFIGLILGSISTFFIGFSGTMISFIAMYLVNKYLGKWVSIIGVSVIGGITHVIGQIIAVIFLYQTETAILYAPQMLIVGVISGVAIGIIGKYMNTYLTHTNVLEKM